MDSRGGESDNGETDIRMRATSSRPFRSDRPSPRTPFRAVPDRSSDKTIPSQDVSTLNDIPSYLQVETRGQWTPARGLLKGSLCTAAAAAVLGAVLCGVTWVSPASTTAVWYDSITATLIMGTFNGMIGFLLAAILFPVMHRCSGLSGGLSTCVVVVLLALVIASKHLVLAALPEGWSELTLQGWEWVEPMTILATNCGAWLAIGLAVAMFRSGESILDYLGIA